MEKEQHNRGLKIVLSPCIEPCIHIYIYTVDKWRQNYPDEWLSPDWLSLSRLDILASVIRRISLPPPRSESFSVHIRSRSIPPSFILFYKDNATCEKSYASIVSKYLLTREIDVQTCFVCLSINNVGSKGGREKRVEKMSFRSVRCHVKIRFYTKWEKFDRWITFIKKYEMSSILFHL